MQDMEPNRVNDTLQHVRIENVSLVGNVGGGIMFGLHKLSDFGKPATAPTSIVIRNCTVDGRGPVLLQSGHHTVHYSHGVGPVSQVGILVAAGGYATNSAGQARLGARGYVEIEDVSISNTSLEGVIIEVGMNLSHS